MLYTYKGHSTAYNEELSTQAICPIGLILVFLLTIPCEFKFVS